MTQAALADVFPVRHPAGWEGLRGQAGPSETRTGSKVQSAGGIPGCHGTAAGAGLFSDAEDAFVGHAPTLHDCSAIQTGRTLANPGVSEYGPVGASAKTDAGGAGNSPRNKRRRAQVYPR